MLCSWVKHRRLGLFQLHKGHKCEYPPWYRWSSSSVFQVHKPCTPSDTVIAFFHETNRTNLSVQQMVKQQLQLQQLLTAVLINFDVQTFCWSKPPGTQSCSHCSWHSCRLWTPTTPNRRDQSLGRTHFHQESNFPTKLDCSSASCKSHSSKIPRSNPAPALCGPTTYCSFPWSANPHCRPSAPPQAPKYPNHGWRWPKRGLLRFQSSEFHESIPPDCKEEISRFLGSTPRRLGPASTNRRSCYPLGVRWYSHHSLQQRHWRRACSKWWTFASFPPVPTLYLL